MMKSRVFLWWPCCGRGNVEAASAADVPAQESLLETSKLDLFISGPNIRQAFKQETAAAETMRVRRGCDLSASRGVHASS